MLSPSTTCTFFSTRVAMADRRTKEKSSSANNVATALKRCGWRGTITVNTFKPRTASNISASSPSRVLAAKNTGRRLPKSVRNAKPSSRLSSGGITSNFKLPVTLTLCAPNAIKRIASASLCAATAVKALKPLVVKLPSLA